MTNILVFGEVQSSGLNPASLEAVTAAMGLRTSSHKVVGALIGHSINSAIESLATAGLEKVIAVQDSRLANYVGEAFLSAAVAIVNEVNPALIIVPHTATSLEWAPRLAARIDAAIVTNCNAFSITDDELVATKPIAGGAFQAQYALSAERKIFTVGAGAFSPTQGNSSACPVENIQVGELDGRVQVLETIEEAASDGPSLRTAKVVVSGGIGLGSAENWKIIEASAQGLNAAVGATRAAVEMGWASSAKQVGFSGLKVSPDLYIAAGISGALHHLAGISRVKHVVAINNDADANIFSVAHYGVIGDAKVVLPAFVARVNELRSK